MPMAAMPLPGDLWAGARLDRSLHPARMLVLVLAAGDPWQRSTAHAIREQGRASPSYVGSVLASLWPPHGHTRGELPPQPLLKARAEQAFTPLFTQWASRLEPSCQLREQSEAHCPNSLSGKPCAAGLGAPAQQRLRDSTGRGCCGARAIAAPADVDQFRAGA